MPKYSSRTGDDQAIDYEDEGFELPDDKAAKDAAQAELADIAQANLPNGQHARFAVQVADEAGRNVYRASLALQSQSPDEVQPVSADDEGAAGEATTTVRRIIDQISNPDRVRGAGL